MRQILNSEGYGWNYRSVLMSLVTLPGLCIFNDSSLEPYDLSDDDTDLQNNVTHLSDHADALRKPDDQDGVSSCSYIAKTWRSRWCKFPLSSLNIFQTKLLHDLTFL